MNPLYLIINKADGSIEEKNGNKCLVFASTDKSKEVLKKYIGLLDGIKILIQKRNGKSGKYEKDYMKIKFNSNDNLPLNKILKFHNLTIIFRSIFKEYSKYYPQFF